MAQGSKKKKSRSPMSELSDDLLVDIISRVSYKSTRRCKCVSRRWRDLVSDPDHRRKLPRSTPAGFFFSRVYNGSERESRCYRSLSGPQHVAPSLSFLPTKYNAAEFCLLDCCNGLLLCQGRMNYVVCNPVTRTWAVVPAILWPGEEAPDALLGFDPAVSSHFHVFEFVHAADKDRGRRRIQTVRIYSSEDDVWSCRSASWEQPVAIRSVSRRAFLDGVLYLSSYLDPAIAAIDLEGNCRVIRRPGGGTGHVYLSRGQLYLATYGSSELSIWALEDSSDGNWILKHNVSHMQLLGTKYSSFPPYFSVIIHPEDNVVFVVFEEGFCDGEQTTKLMSYEMDCREMRFVCDLPHGCTPPYLPYVPVSSESLEGGR